MQLLLSKCMDHVLGYSNSEPRHTKLVVLGQKVKLASVDIPMIRRRKWKELYMSEREHKSSSLRESASLGVVSALGALPSKTKINGDATCTRRYI